MRILFVADGRSPTALNWIGNFVGEGYEAHLVSTYPCSPDLPLASVTVLPVAFGNVAGEQRGNEGSTRRGILRKIVPVGLRTALRQWLGPLTLPGAARHFRSLLADLHPDLVHAIRIPYEGILTAMAMGARKGPGIQARTPLLVSVWGNDFTLHAPSTPLLGYYTRLALRQADALHSDCRRDLRLAQKWGFDAEKPAIVLPGGGGIRMEVFHPPENPGDGPETVINPRGWRAYVRNDIFFRSIPRVLEQFPAARFFCPAMEDEAQARRWIDELGIAKAVELLPRQTPAQMAALYRSAQVAVSPSTHDGTPNTLLEAMACGCFPVAGDIESLREWIDPKINGFLFDPGDPQALAEALIAALKNPQLRKSAAEHNAGLISERAERGKVREKAKAFYRQLVQT